MSARESLWEFGDVRVVEGSTCGHHPQFPARRYACLERLDGPIAEYEGMDLLPTDEVTPNGIGSWRHLALVSTDALGSLVKSITEFQEYARGT